MATGWWALGGVVLGAVLGFILAQVALIAREVSAQRGRWAALRAEIVFAGHQSRGYLSPAGAAATLMRIPLKAHEEALPALLAAGVVSQRETLVLYRFAATAEEFNRGLDRAQDARGDQRRFQDEAGRNDLKAARLMAGDAGAIVTHYDRALGVAEDRARRGWWATACSAFLGPKDVHMVHEAEAREIINTPTQAEVQALAARVRAAARGGR
jgi:hypothetical protein